MSQLETTLDTIRAAFSANTSSETQRQGITALELLLSSLRGAQSAAESPEDTSATAEPQKPAAGADRVPTAKPSVTPDLLDGVIGFLKSQMDADDRAAVDQTASESGFSVPFINF